MSIPHHLLARTVSVLVAASNTDLFVFSSTSSTLLASTLDAPTAHKSFVRLIATYVEPATKQEYVVSTSEDKLLFVWKLPALELVCSRELARRANGLAIAENGDIAVGDKFGDVFLYPLLAPSTELKSEPNGKKATPHPPILGHVSMLTALVLVPIQLPVVERSYIITGDRDEHVRLSRWPQGYVIDKFFFGNKRFITALAYIPPTALSTTPLILSAGGDVALQTFNLKTGERLSSTLVDSLFPHVIVAPSAPPPIPIGKKMQGRAKKLGGRGSGKGKGKNVEVEQEDVVIEVEEEAGAGEDMIEVDQEGNELAVEEKNETSAQNPLRRGMSAWMDGKTTGLAISNIVLLGSREDGGVLVLASGATAVLYIPIDQLLSSTPSTVGPVLLDLSHPILDLSIQSSTTFWVSLDLSRGPPSSEGLCSVRRVELKDGKLVEMESGEFEKLVSSSAALSSESTPLPPTTSLYAPLSLLLDPEETPEAGTLKRSAPTAEEPKGKIIVHPHAIRSGKRLAGRAMIDEKFAEAVRAAAGGAGGSATPSGTDGTEGEGMDEA